MEYTIAKEKGSNRYYVCLVSDKTPIPGTYSDKKKAIKTAAKKNSMDVKSFLKFRKEVEGHD